MHQPSRARFLPWVVVLLCAAGAVAGLVQMVMHAQVFAARAPFPLDLEWMEGGTLLHAHRIAHGQPIYVKPSLEFIPFLYTPLYYVVLAALSKVVGLGYLLGRVVSLVCFAGALAAIVFVAMREGSDRRGRIAGAAVGLAAAGAVAGGFEFTAGFYDLVRADSQLLLLEAAAFALALAGTTWRSAAGAGLVIALAFFTKQTASVMGVALGVGLLVASWRRGLVYGAVAAVVLAAGVAYLTWSSHGWFWTYIFKLHQSHPFRWDTLPTTPRKFAMHLWPSLAALVLATVGLALGGKLRRQDAILWSAALGGLASGLVGFATMWAAENAFIPAVYFPLFAAAALGARLAGHAIATVRPGAVAVAGLAALALGGQSVRFGQPERAQRAPTATHYAAARRFLERLRPLQGDGFIPFHPYYNVLLKHRPYVHRMGVMDVGAALGRPEGLDQAMGSARFPWIVLDWKSQPYEWPGLEARYRIVAELRDDWDTVRNFSGADTWPKYLILPIREPPPLPAGARRVADFETGRWDGWSAQDGAFGGAPSYAPAELYGKFAADSARFGPAATGSLRSPPIRIDHPHLRFTLLGPADPGLRVLLLDGPDTARTATPTGGATPIDWDVTDLQGRDVVLVVEDHSAAAGMAIDDVVLY